MAGILYLVGTPIGNLEDMTYRAIATLRQVALIAAEDTRRTGRLLQHFGIETTQISYHQHNHRTRLDELLSHLKSGQSLALVTDAGMPGISDPGYELVCACLEQSLEIVPIPGVTALTTALPASGLPSDRFVFEGFLPTKNKLRQGRLAALREESRTIIFYEAPHRLLQTLTDLKAQLGDRDLVIARELTKLYEEFWRGSLATAIALCESRGFKGEITLVLAGAVQIEAEPDLEDLKTELRRLCAEGLSPSQASRQLAQSSSLSRRELYQLLLETDTAVSE